MLSCRGLAKTYATERGPIEAVRALDLEVRPGSFAAVIGRSGSGKSTLLAMLGGLSRPTAGRVLIGETDLWALGEARLAAFRNRRIGFVFQFASLLPTLRLIDNVALPALLARAEGATAVYERAAALLAEVGLSGYLEAYPAEVSSGEQRRAAIARALINAPAVLLADEPTADLDAETESEILATLLRINRGRGATLLLVTHNLALAEEADQVLRIAEGMLVA